MPSFLEYNAKEISQTIRKRGNGINVWYPKFETGIKGIQYVNIQIKFVLFERTFKMINRRPLQLFHILLGFGNKLTYFDQKQHAFRHLGYA